MIFFFRLNRFFIFFLSSKYDDDFSFGFLLGEVSNNFL